MRTLLFAVFAVFAEANVALMLLFMKELIGSLVIYLAHTVVIRGAVVFLSDHTSLATLL